MALKALETTVYIDVAEGNSDADVVTSLEVGAPGALDNYPEGDVVALDVSTIRDLNADEQERFEPEEGV